MQRKSGIVDLCSLLMIEMLTKGAAPWGTRFFDNRFPFFLLLSTKRVRNLAIGGEMIGFIRGASPWSRPFRNGFRGGVPMNVGRVSLSLSLSPSPDRSFLPSLLLRRGRYLLGSWAAPRSGHRTSDWRRRRFAKKNPARIGSHNRPWRRTFRCGRPKLKCKGNWKETQMSALQKKRRNADKSMANGWAQRGGATPGRPRFFRAFVGSSQRTTSFWGLVAFGGTAFFFV